MVIIVCIDFATHARAQNNMRTQLKALTVYVTEQQHAALTEAAQKDHRSLSNYILSAALERAQGEHRPTRVVRRVGSALQNRKL